MNPILYLRTSTKDQNPELQRRSGVEFCVERGFGEPEVYSEQGSAYKIEKIRPIWEKVVGVAKKEKRDIIIWKYDRCFRNRKEFYDFMKIMFEVYGTKVYSVTEPSIIGFWDMMDKAHSDNPIFNELLKGLFMALWDFMIQQAGEQAEEESRKKSERVKLAVRKSEGQVTKSYKGNKWGRKNISTQKKNKIKELSKLIPRPSIREISIKSGVSIGAVHKTLLKIDTKKEKDSSVQQLSN